MAEAAARMAPERAAALVLLLGAAVPIRVASGGEAVLLDDSYNGQPAAMRAAVSRSSRSGRKSAVRLSRSPGSTDQVSG